MSHAATLPGQSAETRRVVSPGPEARPFVSQAEGADDADRMGVRGAGGPEPQSSGYPSQGLRRTRRPSLVKYAFR
uniref:Uncharacterized protein n=1 Tax=Human herpesvirus 2 TaxID=10310 RepID=A0A481TFL5_HHV2|nr:hypothetical protein [Human alphaherpesvirus 2]QBH80154.1 hypothetical protein [Human alphaherpesvirus 2]